MLLKLITILIFFFLIYKMTMSMKAVFKGEARKRSEGGGNPGQNPGHSSDPSESGQTTRPDNEEDKEDMVLDEICNSYISETSAIRIDADGKTHHFCSGACRQIFLNSRNNPY